MSARGRGTSTVTPSVTLPRFHSISEANLFSSVGFSEARGNPISHSHNSSSTYVGGDLFPHDLSFGDQFNSLKDDHIFRIGFCNVRGFPVMSSFNDKVQEIKHFMALYDLDLFGRCEANINWSRTPDAMRLHKWFRDIPSCQTFTAHNSMEHAGLKQFGGTFWVGTGLATQYIAGSSCDPLGLCHWSVCTLLS